MVLPVQKYGLWFRTVEERDAEFILSLRTDPVLSRYLSPTVNDVEKQRAWISSYKEREAEGKEYYFIFEDEQHTPQGVIRLYDFNDKTYTCGSWIVKPGADELAALKSDCFAADFAVNHLNLSLALFDVRKANIKVLKYHRRFAKQIREDADNFYFEINREALLKKMGFLDAILRTNI